MEYTATTHTNGEYKRLGDRIRKNPDNVAPEDLVMLQDLRVTFKEPLAIIFKEIEKMAIKVDPECICTYRVKRIESIISKLKRLPKMQLQRAEDIAGMRCIMTTESNVHKLFDHIKKKEYKLPFEIKNVNDYITDPKETGYKSIHVNVQLKGDSRRIEIQLRSLQQHNWATLVEITDQIFGIKLKEYGREAHADLYDFHKLLSKSDEDLSSKERRKIAEVACEHNYLERISSVFIQNYINVRAQWNRQQRYSKTFILISTGSDGIPDFQLYTTFDEAEKAYFELYTNNTESRNIVLTHIRDKSFSKVSTAYSNYFLTYNSILVRIHKIIGEVVVTAYNRNNLPEFSKYYKHYLDIVFDWYKKENDELLAFAQEHSRSPRSNTKAKKEWFESLKKGVKQVNQIFAEVDAQLDWRFWHTFAYLAKRRHYKDFNQRMKDYQQSKKR